MALFYSPKKLVAKGFTLVEFIVIMGIFAIMVGVIIFNFNGFRSTVTLDNLAQDIALSVRQIQTSAGASLSSSISGNPEEEVARGIYFSVDNDGRYENKFVLFIDYDGDGRLSPNEELDTINIQTSDKISGIFYGPDNIASAVNELTGQPVGITFGRFKTAATFSDPSATVNTQGIIRIKVTSADGTQSRFISIAKIGQVSVQVEAPIAPVNP